MSFTATVAAGGDSVYTSVNGAEQPPNSLESHTETFYNQRFSLEINADQM